MAFTSSISSPPVVAVLKVKAAPIKSIFFTDTTLVDATIGTFYSDTATAEAQIGGTPSGALITYSVDTSTPLPKGLSLNGLTGVVSGALPDSSTVETRTVIIVAFSAGYPPQSLSYKFLIMAKTSPPVDTGSSTPPVDTGSSTPPVDTGSSTPPVDTGSSSLISKLSDITTAVPGETNTVTLEMETQTLLAEATELLISNLPSANDVISVEEVVINKPTAALMMTALFSNNSSNLDSKTQKAIIKMALSMKNMNIETITAVGFTNSAGGTDNLKLATARAKSVAKVLTDAGIKIKIAIKSVGITKNATSKEAMIKMRKAEIWVLLKAQETNKVITEE
jgi:outer membrane protein OmpA-like peptidoglycan-associated protein